MRVITTCSYSSCEKSSMLYQACFPSFFLCGWKVLQLYSICIPCAFLFKKDMTNFKHNIRLLRSAIIAKNATYKRFEVNFFLRLTLGLFNHWALELNSKCMHPGCHLYLFSQPLNAYICCCSLSNHLVCMLHLCSSNDE